MIKAKRIILASTSPFRRKLLEDAQISFEVIGATADEKSISGLPPADLAIRRAEFKAIDVARKSPPDSLVIGADQVLGMNDVSFDKAESESEAAERLRNFQGKTHTLYSAYAIAHVHSSGSIEILESNLVPIAMTMRSLDEQSIKDYIATGEWKGCVGCYRIEGQGRSLFSHIGADESAIIGLPMSELLRSLSRYRS